MKDKELIKQINNAYDITPSDGGKAFIRNHTCRKRRLFDVILSECKYGNLVYMIPIILIFAGAAVLCNGNPKCAWIYGSLMPIVVLLSVISFGKSEKYGMWELETVARFSCEFIKTVRLFIFGFVSLGILLFASVIMYAVLDFNVSVIIMSLGIPFLLTAFISLIILRKWRSGGSIYGCMAISLTCAILPEFSGIKEIFAVVPLTVAAVVAAALMVATVWEAICYVRFESEEIAWN